MAAARTTYWDSLERRRSTLFLAAGVLLVVYASLNGMWAFENAATRESGVEFGYVLGFLGLLGLYPSLADRSPWLARVGGVAAASGIVGITAISVTEVAQLAGIASGTPPGWWLFVVLAILGFVLAYLSFGVAVLQTDRYSRTVGLLLLVPGAIVVLMVAHIAAGYASDVTAFVISAGEAMAHLAIGAALRTKYSNTAEDSSTKDAEVGVPEHD